MPPPQMANLKFSGAVFMIEEKNISAPTESTVRKKGGLKESRKQALIFVWAMMGIPVLKILSLYFYTNASTIIMAFQDPRTEAWTFKNFIQFWEILTTNGGVLRLAFKNTLTYFAWGTFFILPCSLLISYFLYKRIFLYKTFRVIFYLPAIISGLVTVTAYTNFISPKGPLGYFMSAMGNPLPPEGLLGRPETATNTIVGYLIWTAFTGNVLYFSSSMARIPIEVLEAGRLEGIKPFEEIIYIVLPFVWPIFSMTIIMQFANITGSSGPILLFTNGEQETITVAHWMFQQVYGNGIIGGSGSYNLLSATGISLTLVFFPLTLFVRWLVNRVEQFEY